MANWNLRLLILTGIIPIFLQFISCSGMDPGFRESGKFPGLSMEETGYFHGSWSGTEMVLDRNGNLRDSARVQRVCESTLQHAGRCRDEIKYSHGTHSSREFEWKRTFQNDYESILTIDYHSGYSIQGTLSSNRSQWFVEGELPLPSENEKEEGSNVLIRLARLPGKPTIIMETRIYRFLMIKLGEEHIVWTKTN